MGRFKTTAQSAAHHHKLLFYAHHGFGKTFQCRYYQKEFGAGLILSGESGLASLSDQEIETVDFVSWERKDLPEGEYDEQRLPFREIAMMLKDPKVQQEYNWIAIDSLTELSQLCMKNAEASYDNPDDLRKWQTYQRNFVGAMKFLRDLPLEVYCTALAKEEQNDKDAVEYWPLVEQTKVQKLLPALFDHVWCGLRTTEETSSEVIIKRHVITDSVRGWHGKSRDPENKLKPVEDGGNVVEMLKRIRGGKKK